MLAKLFTATILDQPKSIGHGILADVRMCEGFTDLLIERVPSLRTIGKRTKMLTSQVFPSWDQAGKRYIYNLVTIQIPWQT